MPTPSTFSALLHAWVGDRSVAEAARVLGVAWGTVDGWLRGVSLPPRTRERFLSALLNVPLAELSALIAADRDRRRAGIPIDTPEQTAAMLAERGLPVPQEA